MMIVGQWSVVCNFKVVIADRDDLSVRIKKMIVRKNALCAVGEGVYACLAHSPTVPNEHNRSLPWLIIGQI